MRSICAGLGRSLYLGLLLVLAACAPDSQPAPWSVSDAHMKAPAPGQTRAAVYLKLANNSADDRRILHLATPVGGTAEVHRHFHEDGVMKMRPVTHATIPARSALVFEPGGHHIMLIDLVGAPPEGGRFPLTLEFDSGEPLVLDVEVRAR